MLRWTTLLLPAALAGLLACCANNNPATDEGMDAGSHAGPDGSTDSDTDTDADSDTEIADAGLDSGQDAASTDTDTDVDTEIPTGDGGCEAIADLQPGLTVLGNTGGMVNDLFDYSCAPLNESNRDVAFRYTRQGASSARIHVDLVPAAGVDLDLFALLGGCSQDLCAAYSATPGDERISLLVEPAETVFIAVDGYPSQAGQFSLTLTEEPAEQVCDDGLDDDGDGSTDCLDEDCAHGPDCIQTCIADFTAACGHSSTISTFGAGDDMQIYSPHACDFTAEEIAFALQEPTGAVEMTVSVQNGPPGMRLISMEGGCASNLVTDLGAGPGTFASPFAGPVYLAADGPIGASGTFDLTIACAELSCGDTVDNDWDGLTDCDDDDCLYDTPCAPSCDILAADAGCPDLPDGGPSACYLSATPPAGTCGSPGTGAESEPCTLPDDCLPGLICPPAGICLRPCDLSAPSCPTGACTSMGADPLGICW